MEPTAVRFSLILACVILVIARASEAFGAVAAADLPVEIVRSTGSLTESQRGEVGAFVESLLPGLSSDSAVEVAEARRALVKPLRDPQVTAPVRIELATRLKSALTNAASGTAESSAVNALVIAGDLATVESLGVIEAGMRSPGAPVRYEAAYASMRVFQTAGSAGASPIRADAVDGHVRTLESWLKTEKEPMVVAALVRALAAAAENTKTEFASSRSRALVSLASGMESRADVSGNKDLSPAMLEAMLLALLTERDQSASIKNPEVSKAAARLAGQSLAHAIRVLASGSRLSEIEGAMIQPREMYAQVAAAAETVIAAAASQLDTGSGVSVRTYNLGDTLRKGTVRDDAQFAIDAKKHVDAGGTLGKPPFSFQTETFKTK